MPIRDPKVLKVTSRHDMAPDVSSELDDLKDFSGGSFIPIDIKDFVSAGLVVSAVKMSHTVDKGTIPDSSAVWYRKELESPAKARREWLAQEFLRLIIPNQVETRLAYNPVSNVYYILSKEVPGFKPLPENEQAKFNDGTYKGLGCIIVGAYFVHEADLKNGNIGLGNDKVVYKIDGDWSFASMRSNAQFPKHTGGINAAQINRLPFPMTYKAHNWLDLYIEGSLASASDIVASDIGNSAQFQQEKLETLFKLLLVPDAYFKQFVDTFIPAGAAEYSDFLIERRTTLLKQAPRIQGFTEYLEANKDKLREMAYAFQEQMKSFVVQGQYSVLSPAEHQGFGNYSEVQFNRVLDTLNISPGGAATALPVTASPATSYSPMGVIISDYKDAANAGAGYQKEAESVIGGGADTTPTSFSSEATSKPSLAGMFAPKGFTRRYSEVEEVESTSMFNFTDKGRRR